jgi:hypothetical protein
MQKTRSQPTNTKNTYAKKRIRKHRYRLFTLIEASNPLQRVSAMEILWFLMLVLVVIYLL